MAKNKRWPKGFGKRAAQLHNGGPNHGGPTWTEVAETLEKEFGIAVGKWDARDNGRSFLRTGGWARWGVPKEADDAGLSVKEYGNYAEIVYTASGRPRIYTVEQLIAFSKFDLDKWVIEQQECTSWEVGAKTRDVDMEYVDGVGTGHIKKGDLAVEQLFRVFVRLVQREPEPVRPTIHPVKAAKTFPFPKPCKTTRPFKRYLTFGDPHFGFFRTAPLTLEPLHDRRALNIILQLAKELEPDAIKIGGDIFDFAEMSKFITSPEYRLLLQPAISEAHWFFAQLRTICPDADISTHEGNHDERMWRHQKQHSAWACELRKATQLLAPPALSVPNLLDLESLGIRWIGDWPNDEDWEGDVRFIHGNIARKNSGETAKVIVYESDFSTFFYHIHRREEANRTVWGNREPRFIFAVSPGCVCRIDGAVPARTNKLNWQQGLAVVDFYGDGYVDKHVVPIRDGRASYNGVTYEGVETVPPEVLEWGG